MDPRCMRRAGRGRSAPPRRGGRVLLGALGAAAALAGAAGPADAFYDDAEVRAILFSREKADALGAPLVLLAHQSSLQMLGNGVRETEEHWLWYVADPAAPACRRVQRIGVLVDRTMETFGLRHCRIYRGDDTLRVEQGHWLPQDPPDWPAGGADPFREIAAELPELEHGDVVEVAYLVKNHWSPGLFPTDWVTLPIADSDAPTIERHIKLAHNTAMKVTLGVTGSEARIIEHLGAQPPLYEVLTGNLPPVAGEATGADAPRFLFSSHLAWGAVRAALSRQGGAFVHNAERLLRAPGDSLAAAHLSSRERLEAVLANLEGRVRRIPRSLAAGTYYPRNPQACLRLAAADRLEWSLLAAALATAAKVHVEVFLARDDLAGFDPAVPIPSQFDRVLLRALLAEEDRAIVFDPWAGGPEQGLVQRAALMLPLGDAQHNLFRLEEGDDLLVPLEDPR